MATAPKLGIVAPQGDLLERLRTVARELQAEELPAFIGALESIKATAWARLTAPSSAQEQHDELLDVATAAERLGVSSDYLYRHSREYAFTRRQGRKLLFSALGIDKHIRQNKT
jgi:hypothetical protein